jgi:histidinol-phosphate aminotransferase
VIPADFIDPGLLSLPPDSRSDHTGLLDLSRNELVHPDLAPLLARALGAVAESVDGRYFQRDQHVARIASALGHHPDGFEVFPGSDAAIGVVLDALTRVHKHMLLQEPTYPSYAHYAQLHGIRVARWPLRPGELRYAVEDPVTAMPALPPSLIVLTNPHGMLGSTLGEGDIASLLSAAETHGHLLVVDECYAAFAVGLAHNTRPGNPHIVILGSFSKRAGLAGLRLGYVAASPEIIGYLRRWRGANAVSEATMRTAALLLEQYTPELAAIRADVIEGRAWLSDQITALASAWRVLPSHANFVALDIRDADQAASVAQSLRTAGILVRHHDSTPALSTLIQITAAPVPLLQPVAARLAALAHAQSSGA